MQRIKYQSIDPRVLLEAVGQHRESFRDMSLTFLRIAPPMLQRLQEAAQAGDCGRAALESHSLKSTAALVGADALARMLAGIEGLSRRAERIPADALPGVAAELAKVMREVRDSIAGAGDSTAA